MRRVLVTGATGFIGRHLLTVLAQRGHATTAVVRHLPESLLPGKHVVLGDIGPETQWGGVLKGIDAVVHLAARAHVLVDLAANPLAEFRRTNVLGTMRLAQAAADQGVRRFVFVSTVGVHGHCSKMGPFTEADATEPHDAYSRSKWEAEQALTEVARETGLELVILRPTLVYGPGNPGNLARLLDVIMSGRPLPFGSVTNQRSLLFVGNLTDAIIQCVGHPMAAGETFLISDGEDISTPALIGRLATAMHRSVWVLPCPPWLLRLAAVALGRGSDADRLLGSLQVDTAKIRKKLGWSPPYTMSQGFQETSAWYLKERTVRREAAA